MVSLLSNTSLKVGNLNYYLENIPMVFITIFWDKETKTSATSYYGSKFLCYSNAKALKQSFDKTMEEHDKK